MRRHAHLDVLKKDIDDQIEKVIELEKAARTRATQAVDAMKDRKVIEKNKEHKLDEYKEMMKNLEIKFLDEIATQRFKKRTGALTTFPALRHLVQT